MAKKERKRYDAAFKENVVLEALKEQKTLSQMASQFGIHANQWKQQVVAGIRVLLSGKAVCPAPDEEGLTTPHLSKPRGTIPILTC